MEIISTSEKQTIDAAHDLAKELSGQEIILLNGDLGMGKSVFCRSLIKALCKDESIEVPSPTFTLLQQYQYDKGIIWHFDLYRLSDPSEIYEIGWEETLENGIVLVEWPERLGALLPKNHIEVTLSKPPQTPPDTRNIEIIYHE